MFSGKIVTFHGDERVKEDILAEIWKQQRKNRSRVKTWNSNRPWSSFNNFKTVICGCDFPLHVIGVPEKVANFFYLRLHSKPLKNSIEFYIKFIKDLPVGVDLFDRNNDINNYLESKKVRIDSIVSKVCRRTAAPEEHRILDNAVKTYSEDQNFEYLYGELCGIAGKLMAANHHIRRRIELLLGANFIKNLQPDPNNLIKMKEGLVHRAGLSTVTLKEIRDHKVRLDSYLGLTLRNSAIKDEEKVLTYIPDKPSERYVPLVSPIGSPLLIRDKSSYIGNETVPKLIEPIGLNGGLVYLARDI